MQLTCHGFRLSLNRPTKGPFFLVTQRGSVVLTRSYLNLFLLSRVNLPAELRKMLPNGLLVDIPQVRILSPNHHSGLQTSMLCKVSSPQILLGLNWTVTVNPKTEVILHSNCRNLHRMGENTIISSLQNAKTGWLSYICSTSIFEADVAFAVAQIIPVICTLV